MKFNNETLSVAVHREWLRDESKAEKKYGHISDWDTSEVTDMSGLFQFTDDFNSPIGDWDVSNVTDMSDMFLGAKSFNQPLEKWDVSKVTNMRGMFHVASSFNQPLEKWDVSRVTDMYGMFRGASSFNQPLEKWDVSQVTHMSEMFEGATSFNHQVPKKKLNTPKNSGEESLTQQIPSIKKDFLKIKSDYESASLAKLKSYNQTVEYCISHWQDFEEDEYQLADVKFLKIQVLFQIGGKGGANENIDKEIAYACKDLIENHSSFRPPNPSSLGALAFEKFLPIFNPTHQIQEIVKEKSNPSFIPENSFDDYNSKAYHLMDEGNFAEAIRVMKQLLDSYKEITGRHTSAYLDTLSVAYFMSNKAQKSIETINEAIELDSHFGEPSKEHYGTRWFIYNYIGDDDKASKDFQVLLKLLNLKTLGKNLELLNNLVENISTLSRLTKMFSVQSNVPQTGIAFNNETLRAAVKEWLDDESKAEKKYGHISDWDTSEVTDMANMFAGATSFNQPLEKWDVSQVMNMYGMFNQCESFNQPLNNWNVSRVVNMRAMFAYTHAFNQPLENWDVSDVIDFGSLFAGSESFNQDISSWNLKSAVFLDRIFAETNSFNQNLDAWNVSNVRVFNQVFYKATAIHKAIPKWTIRQGAKLEEVFDDNQSQLKFNELVIKKDFSAYDFCLGTPREGTFFKNERDVSLSNLKIQSLGKAQRSSQEIILAMESLLKVKLDLPEELCEFLEVVDWDVEIADWTALESDSTQFNYINVGTEVYLKARKSKEEALKAALEYEEEEEDLRFLIEVEYEDGIGIQNESLDFAADIIESDEHWSEDD